MITYTSEIWIRGVRTAKTIKVLGSAQLRPLISITKAYKTVSTDALQSVAGRLPLDLKVELGVLRKWLKVGNIMGEEFEGGREDILDGWHERWDGSDKGRWTYRIFSYVRRRIGIRIELDHCTTQFLTEHGDFNEKLKAFGLVGNPRCRCQEESVSSSTKLAVRRTDVRHDKGKLLLTHHIR